MKKHLFYILIISLNLLYSGCTTSTILRSPETLNKGEFELSVGVTSIESSSIDPIFLAAYGVTDRFEIELRREFDFFSISPRYQLLQSKLHKIDLTIFSEIGYGKNDHFHTGPGVVVGRRFKNIEFYTGYRYRVYINPSNDYQNDLHSISLGSSYYFPKTSWFIRGEAGINHSYGGEFLQYGITIGRTF